MKDNWNLSEKRKPTLSDKVPEGFLFESDVKEFIKRLKEEIINPLLMKWEIDEDVAQSVTTQIDKLAGPELTKSQEQEDYEQEIIEGKI